VKFDGRENACKATVGRCHNVRDRSTRRRFSKFSTGKYERLQHAENISDVTCFYDFQIVCRL